jgi:hypothetical protein
MVVRGHFGFDLTDLGSTQLYSGSHSWATAPRVETPQGVEPGILVENTEAAFKPAVTGPRRQGLYQKNG